MRDIPVYMNSTDAFIEEVRCIGRLICPDFDSDRLDLVFRNTVDLFEGRFPGYRPCNTEYHDLHHTLSTFLAMARIIHGAFVEGEIFTRGQIMVGLTCALLHDSGYIQEVSDGQGTGAKHTLLHIQRSMTFFERHSRKFGILEKEIEDGRAMILCTDLAMDISHVAFSSKPFERLGKMLGAADLLAQMADRTYLEKLLFLYHELREANAGDYQGEVDLLKKTTGFYRFIEQRLKDALDATDQFMISHFKARWHTPENLYHTAIENQKNYLRTIMEKHDADPRKHLKRSGIVDRVHRKYGPEKSG